MNLLQKIKQHEGRIGVVGQGYVGLPLSLLFSEAGFSVLCLDIDVAKVSALNEGRSYIKHIGTERVAAARKNPDRFRATTDFDELASCDVAIICVPTPLGTHREPDLSYVLQTSEEVARRLHKGQLVILESTTYPGTTNDEVRPILESTGLKTPEDFLLAFSPEREDPGNPQFSTRNTPKIVGGVNPESTEAAAELYAQVVQQVVPVSTSQVAESAKLLENIYRSVNIALVNELKMTFDRMGIDIWEVIEAAKTKPFGFQAFYPGPGLGGHCIPLDPFYLTWKAAELGMWTRFIELAGEVNTGMPVYVVDRAARALSDDGKSMRDAKVLVLGLSYKPDIDDDRESPSYEIIHLLRERGAEVSYCDPHFPVAPTTRKHSLELQSVPLTPEEFARHDLVLLATAHEQFKNPSLYKGVNLVVDTRNIVQAGWATTVVRA